MDKVGGQLVFNMTLSHETAVSHKFDPVCGLGITVAASVGETLYMYGETTSLWACSVSPPHQLLPCKPFRGFLGPGLLWVGGLLLGPQGCHWLELGRRVDE